MAVYQQAVAAVVEHPVRVCVDSKQVLLVDVVNVPHGPHRVLRAGPLKALVPLSVDDVRDVRVERRVAAGRAIPVLEAAPVVGVRDEPPAAQHAVHEHRLLRVDPEACIFADSHRVDAFALQRVTTAIGNMSIGGVGRVDKPGQTQQQSE